jgi:ribonuclease BN (tRNA processing enzyme)
VIWPDFTRLPDPAHPVLAFWCRHRGRPGRAAGAPPVEVLPAAHTVPAVGYAVHGASEAGAWVFTGDTGPNPALWERLASLPVAALVIETAFRDDEQNWPHQPATCARPSCWENWPSCDQPTDVYITHIKPGEVEAVMAEVGRLTRVHHIRALMSGQVTDLGPAAEARAIRPPG